ncbi:MAG: hypothetical protein ACJ761_11645 [Chloroflexota bacterium]
MTDPRRFAPVLAILLAIVLAACGQTAPSQAGLTDPTEIVTKASEAAALAKSVHVDATLDGSIVADLGSIVSVGPPLPSLAPSAPSAAASARPVPLSGTSASADIDLISRTAKGSFSVPTIFNLRGDFIQSGTTTYLKSSLTGDRYMAIRGATAAVPVDPVNVPGLIAGLRSILGRDGISPAKAPDVQCGSADCYQVLIPISNAQLRALAGGELPSGLPVDLGSASLALTLRVQKADLRPAGLRVKADLGPSGLLDADLTLSHWDEAVSVSEPPASEVQPIG